MTMDFDVDVFNDEAAVVVEDKTEDVVVPEKAVETPEVPATPEDKDKIIEGLHKARDAERHKRQEAEGKLKKQETAPIVRPDPVTDPDAYTDSVMGEVDGRLLKSKIEQSQELMRDSKDDYEETEKVFITLLTDDSGAIADPKLLSQFNNSRNPAKFAYEHAKKHLDYTDRTAEDYESRIEAKVAARLKAEYEAKGVSALDLPNLSNAAASDSNTEKLIPKETDNDFLWSD
mgnify:CR=1 FL=1